MSELSIIYRSVDDLVPYVNNSRTHNDEQITQIAASIKEFNFTNPILIDGTNGIIAGHGRVLAAQKLDIDQIPCIELSHLTETQKKAYVIADNKLALNAGWDINLLQLEIESLHSNDFNLDLLGFDQSFIQDILEETEKEYFAPDDFKEIEESELKHTCPRCGFEYE